jgi:hypothetical protein
MIEQLIASALVKHDVMIHSLSIYRLVQAECLFQMTESGR